MYQTKMFETLRITVIMLFWNFKTRVKRLANGIKLKLVEIHLDAMRTVTLFENKIYQNQLTRMSQIGGEKTGEWIGMAIGVIVMVLMLPPVADTVLGVNTTAWTFTGAEACKTLMYLIPMVYIAAVIVKIVKTAMK